VLGPNEDEDETPDDIERAFQDCPKKWEGDISSRDGNVS